MGNYMTIQSSSNNAAGKVILSDGTIQEFDQPLTVAELMLEYPQQVVVEFFSQLSEKRPTPLPADKKLEKKKIYLMLPIKRGKAVSLSSEEARNVILTATSVLRSKSLFSSSRFLPFFARICPAAAGIEEGPTTRFVLEKKKSAVEMDEESSELLPESLDNRPEFLSRQLSGKGWKPSLDTIKEKNVEKKIPHWLFNFQT